MKISVCMLESAPFRNGIRGAISKVNKWLQSKEIPIVYSQKLVDGSTSARSITAQLNAYSIDMFLFDGGADINPVRYGEKNSHSYYNADRDEEEFRMLDILSRNYPRIRLSGICRGHQLLYVYFGGKLYQDIWNEEIAHKDHHGAHPAIINKKSVLSSFFQENSSEIVVSSLHHQAANPETIDNTYFIETLSSAIDEVVEGIEFSRKDAYIRGLQSHPEFMRSQYDFFMFLYLLHLDYYWPAFPNKKSSKRGVSDLFKTVMSGPSRRRSSSDSW